MDTTADPPMFNKGFDDIEMLEIGETSSDVDSISRSSIPSMGTEQSEPVVLKEWLNSEKALEFRFNSKQYKASLANTDEFSVAYTKYANALYKIVEDLNELDVKILDSQFQDEPMGVITSESVGRKYMVLRNAKDQINDAFFKTVEEMNQFISTLRDIEYEDIEVYECTLNILDCLHGNIFYPETNLRPQLLTKWVNRFDPQPEQELVEQIMINVQPYRHPLFWNKFISKLVIRGLLDQAINAIRSSRFEELQQQDIQLFQVIEDFLSLLESYNSISLRDKFSHWKMSCCEFRDVFHKFKESVKPENLILLEQIHDLTYIMTGLPKTIANYSDSWYEVYTCLSLYQIRDEESMYSEYLDVSLKENPPLLIGTGDILKTTEKSFLDVLENNFLHVLTKIDEADSCTSALVSRLLEVKGLLTSYYNLDEQTSIDQLMNGRTISEYLLTKFAFQCLNTHNLVPIGMGLLLNDTIISSQSSLNNNKKIIEEFLPKYNCATNDDLEWCLTICAKLGLVSTASELYRLYGTKSLKDGYLYEALNMLINCYNGEDDVQETSEQGMKEVHHIVWDLIFQDSLINNRPINDELINNIVTHQTGPDFDIHPVIKQCLSPYAVLYEFFTSLSSESTGVLAKTKISRIIHLLEFIHLPKRFYPLLLAQLTPFFLDSKYKFQIPDLIVIIELVDNFEAQATSEDKSKAEELYKYSISHYEDEIQPYDWRKALKTKDLQLPNTTTELIGFLRNQIVLKVGKVYVDGL